MNRFIQTDHLLAQFRGLFLPGRSPILLAAGQVANLLIDGSGERIKLVAREMGLGCVSGAKSLGLGKPLMALVTLVSVSCGYWCLSRRLAREALAWTIAALGQTPPLGSRTLTDSRLR